MSKKWLKVLFAAGDPIPRAEWIYGSHDEVKDQAIREFYDTVSLDLEDYYPDSTARWQHYLKSNVLQERENNDFIVFTFKDAPHPRSDMMIISNAALQKQFQRLKGRNKKKWLFAWVDDGTSYRIAEDVIQAAVGDKDEIKKLVTDKVSNRQLRYKHVAKYSVEEFYHPSGFVGHGEDVCNHIAFGEGITVAAVPLSEIPVRADNSIF